MVAQGVVLDSANNPIPNAHITIVGCVGNNCGTSSNINGDFTIDIQGEQTFEISAIGFTTETITVAEGALGFSVELQESTVDLPEATVEASIIKKSKPMLLLLMIGLAVFIIYELNKPS